MSKSLTLKYRPQTFNEFAGNKALIESLRSVITREEGIPASILLQGGSGRGKTTLARIIANEMGINSNDIKELNISNTRGIDAARDIINKVSYSSLSGNKRMIILDEVQNSTKDFQQAMLKTLEEPPPGTHFILCTTDPQKLLKTIRTRCTTYEVSDVTSRDMTALLKRILKKEGVDEFPNDAIKEIIKVSDGCPREAIKILDAVIDIEDDDLLIDAVRKTIGDEVQIKELCQAIAKKAKWKEVAGILKNITDEPESVRRAILGYFSAALLNSGKVEFAYVIGTFSSNYFDSGKAGLIYDCYEATQVGE